MAFYFMAVINGGDPNHVSKSWDDPPSTQHHSSFTLDDAKIDEYKRMIRRSAISALEIDNYSLRIQMSVRFF